MINIELIKGLDNCRVQLKQICREKQGYSLYRAENAIDKSTKDFYKSRADAFEIVINTIDTYIEDLEQEVYKNV